MKRIKDNILTGVAMKRPFIMIRLKEPDYETIEGREKFISVMKESGRAVDSVALFVGNFHNFLPFGELGSHLAATGDAIRDIRRKLGTLTGINVLATIGHNEEAPGCWPLGSMRPMVNYDGTVSFHTPCPASAEFLNDTAEKYGALASLDPDFIWIDDDFRMHNHSPATLGCFCDDCLNGFAEITSASYTRQALVSILTQDTLEAEALRTKWLAWYNRVLLGVVRAIESAVHSRNPRIVLSIMICGGITYDYPAYLDVLRKQTKVVFVRPGGGFYTDTFPFGLVEKAVEYSRQIPLLGVNRGDSVLAEIEHFPYNAPLKARRIYSTEVTASIAAGCDGATINISSMIPGVFNEYRQFLEESEKMHDFWRALSDVVHGLPVAGAWLPRFSSHASLKGHMGAQVPEFPGSPVNLTSAGIPITGDRNNGSFSLLTRSVIEGIPADELAAILSRPAILDATAVKYAQVKGLSHLVGVCVEKEINGHCVEQYLDDEINAGFAGKFRDSRPGFFRNSSAVFKCISSETKPICELKTDYRDGRTLGVSAAVFKNPEGARIASFGYDPWNYIFSWDKIQQIHNLIQWITEDTFPFMVLFPPRVSPILRCKASGKIVVVLVNANFDEVNEIRFCTPRRFFRVEVLKTEGKWERCRVLKSGNTGIITARRKIESWGALVLRLA